MRSGYGAVLEVRGLELHPRRSPAARARSFAPRGQLRPALDRQQLALVRLLEEQLVEDEAQVRVAAARVHHHRPAKRAEHVLQRGAQQPHQVVHLLELAQRVRVEVALAREQVQLPQQLRATGPAAAPAGPAPPLTCFDGRSDATTTSITSGIDLAQAVSMPIFSVAVDDGQPAHEPCMCR